MAALASGIDPLIAEAKQRTRRRRILLAALVVAAVAVASFFVFRPSGSPATSQANSRPATDRNPLAASRFPVDANERQWRKKIALNVGHPLTPRGVARLRLHVIAAVHKVGGTVVRLRVWPRSAAVETVIAMPIPPPGWSGWSRRPYAPKNLVKLTSNHMLSNGCQYLRIVDRHGNDVIYGESSPPPGPVDCLAFLK